MARLITASLVALQLLAIAGCGGGTLTQEDLKRRAIKRKKPEEPSSPAVQTPVATQPVANAVAVTNATAATNRSSPPASNSPAGSSPVTDAPAVANTTATPTQTVGTPTTPAAASGGLPPVVQPPAVPLSPTEAMQRSADNMTQINTAIMTYVKTKGRYPPPAIGNGGPMLSWRVAILPLLGHKALYDQFNLDEPWNSPTNKKLLDRIPPQFQSPERFDTKTNYLLATGTSSLFPSPAKGVTPRKVEDGQGNTAALLEVDEVAAVPWTKPADHKIDLRNPSVNLGNLRSNIILVGWGNGMVTAIDSATPPNTMRAIFTIDAGEQFVAVTIQQEIPTNTAATSVATNTVAPTSATGSTQPAGAATTTARAPIRQATGQRRLPSQQAAQIPEGPNTPIAMRAQQQRLPVPSETARKKSSKLIQSIFGERYRSAKSPEQKQQIAVAMLDETKNVERGSPDEYALLRAGWKIAIAARDYKTAESFRTSLVQSFAVPDEIRLQSDTVEKLSTARLSASQADELLTTARFAVEDSAYADDFATAQSMLEIAERLGRRLRDAEAVRALGKRSTQLKRLSREHARVSSVLDSIGSSDDPAASYKVGRYFCYLKGQWEKGLPLLAEGNDLQSRRLATEEISLSIHPDDQISVADGWWDLSLDVPSLEKENLRKHAVSIYERAFSGLQGLAKTKISMRLDEYYREFGGIDSRRKLATQQAPLGGRRGRSPDRDDDD